MKFWQLLCVTRRQANLDGSLSDNHAIDMALDQVAIHPVDRKLQRSKMRADGVQHELLEVGCRHTRDEPPRARGIHGARRMGLQAEDDSDLGQG
jgi:hypothetical protein